MAAPLTNKQKMILAKLAADAFRLHPTNEDKPGETLEDFRRRHVSLACGKDGLRCFSQDDYGHVKAHFQDMLGQSGKALKTLVHSAGNARRIVEWKILRALDEAGFQIGYAAKICRAQFRCDLDEATERQLWCLFFTITNRRKEYAPN